jgi:hypothetical protein
MRRFAFSLLPLFFLTLFWGCEPATEQTAEEPSTAKPPEKLLPRPFTAEQIRDEWIPGFQLKMLRRLSEAQDLEQWTVVTADEEGAEIEYASLDAEGNVVGDPRVERTTWTALRDHASFPVDQASREEVTRTTELGELTGWLYTVKDLEAGTVTEFFFAKDLPGAPVDFRMKAADLVVMELRQVERSRPKGA